MDGLATFSRAGYWSALVCAIGAVAYGVVGVLVGILAPSALSWEGYSQFVAGYSPWPTLVVLAPPFVVAVAFPLLILAIYATAPEERKPFALLALVFAGIYTAVLGAAYWLQLTTVPWNMVRGSADGIAPWVVWNPAGFFWSLETFGYFAMGLSCMFAAFAHRRDSLPRGLRYGLLAMGPLGLFFLTTSLKDLVFDPTPLADPEGVETWASMWSLSAGLAWVLLFGFVSISLTRWFARLHVDAMTPRPNTRNTI